MNTRRTPPAPLSLSPQALHAAAAGLDFLLRHQLLDPLSADHGRLPFVYDCAEHRVVNHTTNWTTGMAVLALLAGNKLQRADDYRRAAGRAAAYLRSLQAGSLDRPRVRGVFREVSPQSGMAHPRDALTAAWALLEFAHHTGDLDAFDRAHVYADWFIRVGLELGYPYWTVRFDHQPWEPTYCGSFHSGSAFFLNRMFQMTGEEHYRAAARVILDFYNRHHLDEHGRITVILDRQTLQSLDGRADPRYSNPGWEMMHVYNDDFGALANLSAWRIDGRDDYRAAAERFLRRMLDTQNDDGGFGPPGNSIPSAAGMVLIELLVARSLGCDLASTRQLDRAAQYLMNVQIRRPGDVADGAFLGFTDQYILDDRTANIRAGAYAIIALLLYAGAAELLPST